MKVKAVLTILALLLGYAASAQTGPSAWKEVCDSAQVIMKEKTGVTVEVKLRSALKKGNSVELYFTERLKDYPWKKDDVKWFRQLLSDMTPEYCKGLKIGIIYAKAQQIEELAGDPLGNDGEPFSKTFRTTDRRHDAKPLTYREDIPQFDKGLFGRHIALWQSHGYYYNRKSDRWMWQRAPLFTTVEDVYTLTYVLPFLAPMLENAGANVLMPRERDYSRFETILKPEGNSWKAEISERGKYAVYVKYKKTSTSSDKAVYTVGHMGGKTSVCVNQKIGGGAMVYIGSFDFDQGNYEITLSNEGSSGTTVDAGQIKIGGGVGPSGKPRYVEGAKYWMQHTGVDRTVWDQNNGEDDYRDDFMLRGAWVNWLSAGSALHPGKYVPPKDGDGKKPEDRTGLAIPVDLAFGFHSDAGLTPNDSIVGTLSIYTRLSENKSVFPDGEDRGINRPLTDIVQTQIVDDIRQQWNPKWTRREIWDKSYSESRTPNVPAMLLELLAHQNFEDMKYGLDPAFRFTVSRAVYKGILKFLSNRYGCPYVVQPLPVHGFAAEIKDKNTVRLSWKATEDPLEPTAKAQSYWLYTRVDNGAFDDGVPVDGNAVDVKIIDGHVYSWKVAAVNEGGFSFPSEILAAGVPSSGSLDHSVLVVNNFTRVGGPVWLDTEHYAGFNTNLDGGVPYISNPGYIGEMYEWRRDMKWKTDDDAGFGASFLDHAGTPVAGNTFDFVAVHGKAILSSGHAFSSASSEWFATSCESAWAVDLICGKQMTVKTGTSGAPKYTVFTQSIQDKISSLTLAGTHFLVSGANIAKDASDNFWPVDIDPAFKKATEKFMSNTLGYTHMSSHGTRSANVTTDGGRKSPETTMKIRDFHFNNVLSEDRYCVESADAIAPADSKGRGFLRYADSGTTAGICYNPGKYKTVCLGFPIEVITDDEAINELIASSIRYFER
ncbi:MAG: hypothetical protein MJY72_01570 [Bacteroidales bacterium]|nr:hypothetical protein [Bacteroidales bacterium]